MRKLKTVADLAFLRESIRKDRDGSKTLLTVCGGTGCQASKCKAVIRAVKKELTSQKLTKNSLGQIPSVTMQNMLQVMYQLLTTIIWKRVTMLDPKSLKFIR